MYRAEASLMIPVVDSAIALKKQNMLFQLVIVHDVASPAIELSRRVSSSLNHGISAEAKLRDKLRE